LTLLDIIIIIIINARRLTAVCTLRTIAGLLLKFANF